MPIEQEQRYKRFIRRWLLIVYVMIGAMILLGGITRLTDSGLSMISWKPILGTLPPLSSNSWQHAFDQYKLYPQYQVLNPTMGLSEFKAIYFWEYIHRLVARLLGLIYLIPLVYLITSKKVNPVLKLNLLAIGLLGALQAFLGWFMVQSGLNELPTISHIRLSAHLTLAFTIAAYTWWIYLNQHVLPCGIPKPSLARASKIFSIILIIQISLGGLMAGLKAGYLYNTFPDYNGLPLPDLSNLAPLNVEMFFNSSQIVHFMHRTLGLLITGYAFSLGFRSIRRSSNRHQFYVSITFLTITILQVCLGIATIVNNLPIWLCSLHQLTAFLLVGVTLTHAYIFENTPRLETAFTQKSSSGFHSESM